MKTASRWLLTFFGVFTFFVAPGSPSPAHALQFNVSRPDDPAPDACLSGVDCSLREAVMAANANAGPDLIVLQEATTYTLSIPGSGGAEEGDLDVAESLTVQGGNKVTTVIDTAPDFNDRIFQVDTGGNTVSIDFTVSDLTLKGGETDGNGGAVSISGFDPQGIFTNVIVQNNQAAGSGGGIFFSSGQARQFSLQGSDILNNSSASGGGGVYCTGAGIACDVNESRFSGNESANGQGGGMLIGTGGDGSLQHTIAKSVFENNISTGAGNGSGGGLQFGSSKGLRITESQFQGNVGNGDGGGGAYITSGGQAVSVEKCVVKDNASDGNGGGIYVSLGGTVLVTESTFDNNESRAGSSTGRGGGLYVNNGNDASVTQNTFNANRADAEGGGVFLESFGVNRPTFTGNTVSGNNSALPGGGAYFAGANGPTVATSTFSANTTDSFGGGAYFSAATGPVVTTSTFGGNTSALSGGGGFFSGGSAAAVATSTFSANRAEGEGGGAYFTSGTGPVVTNSTFSGNMAELSGGGIRLAVGGPSSLNNITVVQNTSTTGTGGGVQANPGISVSLHNSLFFQNNAASGATDDCAGFVTSGGYNVFGSEADNADCRVVSDGVNPTDQFGVDPVIGGLGNNGGPTFTHALMTGSPAIDGGNPSGCKGTDGNDLTQDQRGKVRPFGAACDIGAFEVSPDDQICEGSPGIDADLGSALGASVATGTTVGGGDDFNTSCGASNKEDRTYVWTAPQDGTYSFSLTDPNSAVLALTFANSDCQGDFECHFPNSPFGPRIIRTFPAGTKVVIKVDDSRNDGSFDLDIFLSEAGQCSDGIDNDGDGPVDAADMFDCVCNGKPIVDANLGSAFGKPIVTGTTVGGGDDFTTSCGASGKEDRAYVWTSPADGTYEFYLSDPDGAVLAMTFSDGTCVGDFACLFPNAPFGDRITRFFPAGTSVVLIVDDSRNDGSFELNIAAVGDCVPEECDDDNACNGVETCQNNQCTPGTPVACSDDGNQCNGALPVCNPSTGQCADSIPPVTCSDDGNQCNGTTPVCDPSTGQCADSVPPVICDDGNACNGLEVCEPSNGKCALGTPVVCDDGNQCNGMETCDPSNGQCLPGTPVVCGDGNVCNGEEICEPSNGKCAVGTPLDCDDDNVCNGGETCDPVSGCQPGEPLDCQDGIFCNGVEVCHPTMGCQSGPPTDCEDNDPCTADSCDELQGCRHDPLPDGDNDGICDANDACPNDPDNDVDFDGVCGDVDNCPEDANPDQTDTDNDGIGDACDTGGEPEACSVDFTGFPNSHCFRTTVVRSMAELQNWLNGPRTTNLKVLGHRHGGSYNLGGQDLAVQTSCEVEFNAQATFFNAGDVNITASEVLVRNDILAAPDSTMRLRSGRLVEVKRGSLAKLSVVAESPVVLYKGDVNDKMNGEVALCGHLVEIRSASMMKVTKLFAHATRDLIIGGDILGASQVTLVSDDDMELRMSNNIGSFYSPIGNLSATVASQFDDLGDIVANGTVMIQTGSFTLFRSHFFDVDGECKITGTPAGSRPVQGKCAPGIQ